MARIKYYYDTETCKYERLRVSSLDMILNSLGFVFVSIIFAAGLLWIYLSYFESPKEAMLARERDELILYYEILNKELEESNKMLSALQERDDNIYRVIFEAEPIPQSIRNSGSGALNRYKHLLGKNLKREEVILSTVTKIEKLKKQMYIQTKSYDEIIKLAKNKTQMLACIPAIQPVHNKELNKLASGFGMRIHPIYKVKIMHTGVDFAAPRGTAIYATGDGVVKVVTTHFGGYGKEIEIDHGYGYVTKYAHLEKFNVKPGQKVKRGELIGYVGNTGTSTAPHLHYEVIYNTKKVNPVHYFYNDLNPAEYEKILELAAIENQSLS
jgi:murein DD-endopeptidase MepM/ murein hydrolase activator NlpD